VPANYLRITLVDPITGKWGHCEGSCDFDIQCESGMECFQRKSAFYNELGPVPGVRMCMKLIL